MVHQPSQSGEIDEAPKRGKLASILFDAFVMIIVAIATFSFFRLTLLKPENREINNPSVVNKPTFSEKTEEKD